MTRQNLKYAALSTYRTTVFIRRAGGYRFELSLPIDLPGHLSEDASLPFVFSPLKTQITSSLSTFVRKG